LLDDLFEDPQAKAVVFSQWLGTHELIQRRLAQRGWGHVLFTGQVPGDKRGALVQRFHDDPACRLFLATDAGGVGLNLQHAAAIVVNMDLPWNPAVLEQRIGRVHRMGQSRGVLVVNFVGEACIEEGMLSVLAFKKSLFAGALDGGAADVFMQGTRLSQFMRSVEQVSGAISPAAAADEEAAARVPRPDAQQPPAPDESLAADAAVSAPSSRPAADPWGGLLQAGAALLQNLADARAAPEAGAAPVEALFKIEPDPSSGRASVRIPLPPPQVLGDLARALAAWLEQAPPLRTENRNPA
jgi:Helicase conserved C-terminal domain